MESSSCGNVEYLILLGLMHDCPVFLKGEYVRQYVLMLKTAHSFLYKLYVTFDILQHEIFKLIF